MIEITELIETSKEALPVLKTIIAVIIIFIVLSVIISFITRGLLKKAKTKKQISNIKIFSRALKYFILLILIVFAFFTYVGSWTGLGLTVGLFSAALGWALQKPITGIAGWVMIITKRPFEIGDRIIINKIKGDVVDITLTHVHVKEVGGIVGGEERSGRTIMLPNSILFDQNIINYTQHNDFVLGQVVVSITNESNLKKAIQIAVEAAEKHTEKSNEDPYVRTFFHPDGISVHVRYFSPAKEMEAISSIITKEIHETICKTKDVETALPHREVVFRKKKKKKKKKKK